MEYIVKYSGDILSLGYPTDLLGQNYAILELTDQEARQLWRHRQVEYYEPAKRLTPAIQRGLDAACIRPVQRAGPLGLTGQGVMVGLVDSGIDLDHPDFRTAEGGTRVVDLWDMTLAGTPPPGFRRGAVFTSREIDAGQVPSRDRRGHGTAAAGIAAGNTGAAPGAAIAVVKLPDRDPQTTDIMRGIKFLLDRAAERNMPCAINLSYGTNNGSHWGQSLFETYIDAMALQWKNVLVAAAGNEGSGGHHFFDRLRPGQTVLAEFTVATARELVYLSLWKSFADTASFELVLPSGATTGVLTARAQPYAFTFGDIRVGVLFRGPTHYSTAQEVYIQLEGPRGSMDGLWTLKCTGIQVVDGWFDIWLPTVEDVTEATAFLRPQPDLTITLPATAAQPISVGGYRTATETLSPFSGRGDGQCRGRVLLDITAPAEDILAPRPGGGYGSFTGTSMAAPFVTGAAALMMEWGVVRGNDPFLYGQRVKAYLCKNAARSPFWDYPNPLWGYGKLYLCGAMNDLTGRGKGGGV